MPKLFEFGRYVFFFWSAENGEPIHVHVAVRCPSEHATKIWLTRSGGCLLANNNADIPVKDLRKLLTIVTANHADICKKWREYFNEIPSFYC